MNLILIIFISYLIGSIPASILVCKIWSGIDIREHGSGNAGTTNVFRVLGWKPGIIVGIIDITKGFIAVVFISKIGAVSLDYILVQIIAGLSAVTGHIWTIFAGFKGGKGALTALGMLIGITPLAAGVCFTIWGFVFYISKYVSLGSIIAAICFPVIITLEKYFFNKNVSNYLLAFSILICTLIVFTHRSNIKRLFSGTENKFGKK